LASFAGSFFRGPFLFVFERYFASLWGPFLVEKMYFFDIPTLFHKNVKNGTKPPFFAGFRGFQGLQNRSNLRLFSTLFMYRFSLGFFVDFWSMLAPLWGAKNGLIFSKSHFGAPKTAERPILERPKIDIFS